jgi:hypothetical protein
MRRILVVMVALLATAGVARAQETRGALSGRILESDGQPLAGVSVTVEGARLQGARQVATDAGGYFRLTALPVGTYSVRVETLGYRTVIYDGVRVLLGQQTALAGGTIMLETAPVEVEPLVVTTERPPIDASTAAIELSIPDSVFLEVPTQRDYRDLIRLAPMADPSFNGDPINVGGATGLENLTFVDGLNTTDPFFGAEGTKLPYNFVKEFQVKTGGYEAEYGGAMGGIFNVVTQSGGNRWTASAFAYFNNAGLTADANLGASQLMSRGANSYDIGVAVGGPIIRDRLWFFGAYDPTFQNAEVQIPDQGYFEETLTEHLFAGKLNWRAGPATEVVLSVFGDPSTYDRVGGGPFTFATTVLDPDVFLGRVENGGTNANLMATHRFANTAALELSLGGQWTSVYDGPRPGDDAARYTCITATDCDGLVNGTVEGGFGELYSFSGRQYSIRLVSTFFLGSHTPKVGVEYDDYGLKPYESRTTGEGVILDFGQASEPFRWFVIVDSRVADLKARAPTVFAQDSWALTRRFRLNYGLRWDGQYLIDSEGSVGQSFTDQWQPRLGFVWELGKIGTQKITASAGRFYHRMPLRLSTNDYTSALDAQNYFEFYDGDPRLGGQPIPDTRFVFCCSIQRERDLLGTHYDELTLGYERLLGRHARVGVKGIYRTLRQVVNIGNPPGDNTPAFPGNPGRGGLSNLDDPKREYTALEFTAAWLNAERISASASYVLSRTYGNFPGIFNADVGLAFPNDNQVFREEFQMVNNEGLLPNDRTHVLKLWGSYRFDFGLTAGTFFSLASGTPVSRTERFFGGQLRFISPRGTEGRTPTLWDWSVRLQYPIRTRSTLGWNAKLVVDFLNIATPQGGGKYDEAELFDVEGNGTTTPNPLYGEPLAYQEPFTVRLGIAVGF